MSIRVTGKNLEVGETLRSYVQDRLDQTMGKYVGRSQACHVRVEKEHGQFRTDLTVHLWSGLSLEAHALAHDAYASADAALARIEKRIRRYKDRLKDRSSHSGTGAAGEQAPYYVIQQADQEAEDVADDNPVIIAETELAIHEIPVSDAVMQMDISDRPFVVFRNPRHGQINVVYRRQDGNIGWIDPAGARDSDR